MYGARRRECGLPLYVTTPAALGLHGAVDCGACVSLFMLAPILRAELGLPADRLVLCGISFGYAGEDHPDNRFRTSRAAPEEVLDWRA